MVDFPVTVRYSSSCRSLSASSNISRVTICRGGKSESVIGSQTQLINNLPIQCRHNKSSTAANSKPPGSSTLNFVPEHMPGNDI